MQGIDHIPVANALGGWPTEGSLAVEGVEHYAFEQVTQGHVVIFGEGLENFAKTFFHAAAGLNALDKELRFIDHGTNVPWYINGGQWMCGFIRRRGKPRLYRWFIRSGRVQGSEFSSPGRRSSRFSACLGGCPWFCRRGSSDVR